MTDGRAGKLERIFELALRFRSPLAIAGLVLLALYAVLGKVLESLEFEKLTSQGSETVVQSILRYVFIIALVTIILSIVSFVLPKIIPKALFIPTPQLDYGVVVFRLIAPGEGNLAQVLQYIEPFPGFPYYSRESDHPSAWPRRVIADRQKLHAQYVAVYNDPNLRKRLDNSLLEKDTVKILGGAPGQKQEERALDEYISSARSQLVKGALKGDPAISQLLGPDLLNRLLEVEQMRVELRQWFPNRLAVVRVRNGGNRDVTNLGIELEIAGMVYDYKIVADPEKVQHSSWDEDAHRVTFERLPSGYTAEIRIWYIYQSLSDKAFPDKIDIIRELTQGFRVINLAGSRTKVRYNRELVEDLLGYDRLYIGDARKKDSYDVEIAAFMEKAGEEMEEHSREYDQKHPTLQNIEVANLSQVAVADNMIDNIWLAFRSPAGRLYDAVHVFTHPKGPYVLLSSKDRDKQDMSVVQARLVAGYLGTAEPDISDRSDDISATVEVAGGFTKAAIVTVAGALAKEGYTDLIVTRIHYHTE
jgi:hypothetical protein